MIAALYTLPAEKSGDGPLAQLPAPTTTLPRAKPLPKPKPPTKWERFAAAKGIQKKRKEKKVWDEEKQDWVNGWGRGGKNKEKEDQWIHEVKANAGAIFTCFHFILGYVSYISTEVDFDPVQAARNERKSRVAKNTRHQLQNLARAQASRDERDQRKADIEKTLAVTRSSTASMGKFDKKLEGDKKLRGVKRKVCIQTTERSRQACSFWRSSTQQKCLRKKKKKPRFQFCRSWMEMLKGRE